MTPRGRFALAAPLIALAMLALAPGTSPALAARTRNPRKIANKVLKLDPRKPADINLFTSKFSDTGAQRRLSQTAARCTRRAAPS